jgi:bacteriorhodopsin
MSGVVNTANQISLLVQAITGLVGFSGLYAIVPPQDVILQKVLGLEMLVQVVEFLFYIGLVSIYNVTQVTQVRYYDWFLSTPIMLFTISLYFYYIHTTEEHENKNDDDKEQKKNTTLNKFTQDNWKQIAGFTGLNFLMLLFGFLTEFGLVERLLAFFLGTGALCGSFGIIYQSYAQYSSKSIFLFWIMFLLWSLYGVAFLLSPVLKNISYTILDIFAKNFFGIFLSVMIWNKSLKFTN